MFECDIIMEQNEIKFRINAKSWRQRQIQREREREVKERENGCVQDDCSFSTTSLQSSRKSPVPNMVRHLKAAYNILHIQFKSDGIAGNMWCNMHFLFLLLQRQSQLQRGYALKALHLIIIKEVSDVLLLCAFFPFVYLLIVCFCIEKLCTVPCQHTSNRMVQIPVRVQVQILTICLIYGGTSMTSRYIYFFNILNCRQYELQGVQLAYAILLLYHNKSHNVLAHNILGHAWYTCIVLFYFAIMKVCLAFNIEANFNSFLLQDAILLQVSQHSTLI